MGHTQIRKYEEYAYVLDVKSRSKSVTVRGRTGIIVIAIGEERLTLLLQLQLFLSFHELLLI
jgi:predicted nucleic acid-binding OB-fold protein